jgi:ABC-2 type transport system permease protein
MTVHDRTWHAYGGRRTRPRTRFLIVTRFAYADVLGSRLFVALCLAGLLVPGVTAIAMYLRHNAAALAALGIVPATLPPIDAAFFLNFLVAQAVVTALLALFVGPALIAPDLADNALPLYLCRPFSRAEYLLGKGMVLVSLMSALTWVAGLLLFAFQTSLDGLPWARAHASLAAALLVGAWVWIAVVTLVCLAVSAWVRRLAFARGMLVALWVLPSAMGGMVNGILETSWGGLMSPLNLIRTVWLSLFAVPVAPPSAPGSPGATTVPVGAAWAVLIGVALVALWLLHHKVRAYEVVRS